MEIADGSEVGGPGQRAEIRGQRSEVRRSVLFFARHLSRLAEWKRPSLSEAKEREERKDRNFNRE